MGRGVVGGGWNCTVGTLRDASCRFWLFLQSKPAQLQWQRHVCVCVSVFVCVCLCVCVGVYWLCLCVCVSASALTNSPACD